MRLLLLCALLLGQVVTRLVAAEAEPLSETEKARAAEALALLSQEDALAAELAPPAADDGLSLDDREVLHALEFDLLEAERWIVEGELAVAGESYVRMNKLRRSLDHQRRQRLGARLALLDKRLLAVTRALLAGLGDPSQPASGQVDETPSVQVAPAAPEGEPVAADGVLRPVSQDE
jgi:hypothetical protein